MTSGKPLNEADLFSSFNDDSLGVGNVASTINSKFGMGLDFDTKDFNTKHADDAVDFEDISLTDESDHGERETPTKQDAEVKKVDNKKTDLHFPQDGLGGQNQFDSLDLNNEMLNFNDYPTQNNLFDSSMINEANNHFFDNLFSQPDDQTPHYGSGHIPVRMPGLAADRLTDQETNQNAERLLEYYYPMFKKDAVLKMHSLFRSVPGSTIYNNYFSQTAFKGQRKVLMPSRIHVEVEADEKKMFSKKKRPYNAPSGQKIVYITDADYEVFRNRSQRHIEQSTDDYETVLAAADWDDDVVLGEQSTKRTKLDLYRFDDYQIEDPDDLFEGRVTKTTNLKLDMNDPHLLFTPRDAGWRSKSSRQVGGAMRGNARCLIPTSDLHVAARFNVSNDTEYERLKENYHTKIRATIGNLVIDHSMPAMRLQSPYFKVKLTKQQMRSYHRPKFIVRANTVMCFSKPKVRKRKKDRGKDPKEIYRRTTDLSLGDTAPVYLLEYSEEHPVVLSNFGMGSKLVNYYRKQSESDTRRPRGLAGETHVLGVQDRSPFWNFGFVERGKLVPTLYNQMVRAPVFLHDAAGTDFLLVKSSGGARTRYFLRSLGTVFLVGQLYPAVEVPGPHSRKVTTVSKNRLKMIVFRVLNHSKRQRLAVKDISPHFPDQNDMQNRQRLKEFMVYQRTGEDQGFWKIKPTEKLPSEEEIRAMISPEDLCLLESMQVGQQHLQDYAVYSYDNINLERYSNFVSKFNRRNENSASPMGNGADEGAAGNDGGAHYGDLSDDGTRDNVSQREVFEELLAPWNTTRNFINATQGKAMLQLKGEGEPTGRGEGFSFLRTSMKGGFKALEESDPRQGGSRAGGGHSYNVVLQQKAYDEEIKKTWNRQVAALSADELLQYSRELPAKSRYNNRSLKSTAPKVLRVTRMVRNQYGVLERQVEVIKDERIINAYLLRKKEQYHEYLQSQSQQISQSIDLASVKIPTNEDEKKLLQQELEKLQAQKNNKKVLQSGKGIGKGKNTKRRCALCGAVGHIRTKKSCPMYGKTPLPGGPLNMSSPGPTATSASSPASS